MEIVNALELKMSVQSAFTEQVGSRAAYFRELLLFSAFHMIDFASGCFGKALKTNMTKKFMDVF
jgi:hypothetical protein